MTQLQAQGAQGGSSLRWGAVCAGAPSVFSSFTHSRVRRDSGQGLSRRAGGEKHNIHT